MPIQDLMAPLPPGVLSPPDSPLQVHTAMVKLPRDILKPQAMASTLNQAWGKSPPFLFLRCRGHDRVMELPAGPNQSFQVQEFPLREDMDSFKTMGSYSVYRIGKTISGRTMVLSSTGVLALYPTSHLHPSPREEPVVFHTVFLDVNEHIMFLCPLSGVVGILGSSRAIHIRRYRWVLQQKFLPYARPNLICFPLGPGISRQCLPSNDMGDPLTVTL